MVDHCTTLARNLRRRSTDAERLLWRHLRADRLDGLKFRRQQPIGEYIVDFVCLEKRVSIELDGSHHEEVKGKKGSIIEAKGERFSQVSRVVRLFGFYQYMIKKVLSQTEWVKSLSLEGRGLGEGD